MPALNADAADKGRNTDLPGMESNVRPRPSTGGTTEETTSLVPTTIRRNDPTILNNDNFSIWKWSLKYNLKSLGLYECLIHPENTTQEQWDAAMYEIISTISDRIKIKVAHCKTPRDLYTSIEALYVNKTSFQVTDLHMRLTSFKFNSTHNISDGLSQVQSIVAKLKNLNEPVSDHLVEGIILAALPESFRTFITVWKGLNASERTLTNLMSRLMAEVEDNKLFEHKYGKALMAKEYHKKNARPKVQQKGKQNNIAKKCSHCDKTGHTQDNCWQLHPEKKTIKSRNDNKKGKGDRGQPKHITYMAIEGSKNRLPVTQWIADSGASNHMTYCREWFHVYQRFEDTREIQCSNGQSIPALGKGIIRTKQGDICDVFYVPDIAANLFSLGAAMNHGLSTMMTKTSIMIYRDLVKILEGTAINGTYVLNFDIIVNNTAKAFITRTLKDWHNRMGHVSKMVIMDMARKKTVDGLQVNSQEEQFFCDDCILNKGSSASHPIRTTTKIKKPGVCLHFDTAGPMRVLGLYGERFYVLAKDEASSYRIVVCVETKSEIPNRVKLIINRAELETKNKVFKIVTDGGTEYWNADLRNFLNSRGIQHHKTVPYTPQQNGFIERDMRTIGESSRTMLNSSELPHALWPEAVKTAVYVLNRVTTSRDSESTPYEKWHAVKPNVKNLRIFGQRAIVNRPIPFRDGKWDLTGDVMWFVGYGERFNTYRFYSKAKDAVIDSCDVTFIDKSLEPEILLAEASNEPHLEIQRAYPTVPAWVHKQNESKSPRIMGQNSAVEQSSSKDSSYRTETWLDNHNSERSLIGDDSRDASSSSAENMCSCVPNNNQTCSRCNQKDIRNLDASYNEMRQLLEEAGRDEIMSSTPDQLHIDSEDAISDLDDSVNDSFESAQNDDGGNNEAATASIPKNLKIHGKAPTILEKRTRSQNFALNTLIVEEDDPKDYKDIMGREDRSQWLAAMKDEIGSLAKNKVWTLVNRPKGVNIVTNRWVLKIKRKPDGSVDRYRARLVARGFSQVHGLDFNETYAPVVNMASVRLLFAYAATQSLHMKQFDVKTAFLYGNLDETVYMEQPEGFKDGTSKVCHLKKSLYGLKQAPRQWNKEFSNFLKEQNLNESQHDRCIFYRQKPSKLFIAIYVDDGVIFAEKEDDIKSVLQELKKRFEIHIVETPIFLGFQIDYNRKKKQAILHQEAYVRKVLERFNMDNCSAVENPSTTSRNTIAEKMSAPLPSNTPYREAIGSLLYAANITRCDIAYAVNRVSRKVAEPTTFDWQNVKRILRYMKGDKMALKYSEMDNKGLVAYCDSDFAGDESSKSTTGFVINYGGAPILWKSQKQKLVSLSSTEAELVSIGSTVKELSWLRQLAQELEIIDNKPTVIHCDNQSAIYLALNEKSVQRTRHMGVRAAFTREQVAHGEVEVRHIKTDYQLADFLTKPLSNGRFTSLRNKLMFLMSILAMLTLCRAINFEDTKPLIWIPDEHYVDGGVVDYEIYYFYSSPCEAVRALLPKDSSLATRHVVETAEIGREALIRETRNVQIQSYIPPQVIQQGAQAVYQNQAVQLTPQQLAQQQAQAQHHQQTQQQHQFHHQQGFQGRTNEIVPGPNQIVSAINVDANNKLVGSRFEHLRPEELIIGQMIDECERSWNSTFVQLMNEWPNKVKFHRKEVLNRHSRDADRHSNITKRDMISDFAIGAMKTVGKGVMGGVISNLISTVFDRLNPHSDHNQLKNVKADIVTLKNHFYANFNMTYEIQKGLINSLQQVGIMELENRHKIDYLMTMVPKVSWTSSFLQTRIMAHAADLRIIMDDYAHGRVAVKEMANLLNIQELRESNIAVTEFTSVDMIGTNLLKIAFKVMETSNDTFVYRVNAFNYWENLSDLPTLMEYKGPEYLIFNTSNNCMQSIEKPGQLIIEDQCLQDNYVDPKLQKWKPIIQTRNIDMFNETCQEKRTLLYNYIYCFPYQIHLKEGIFRMPPNTFRLPTSIEYEIPGKPKYMPRRYVFNISTDLPAIDSIHTGHFPMGSEVIDQTKWFEKLQDLHKLNEKLYHNEERSVMITKYGAAWWIIILTIIIWAKFTIVLIVFYYNLKTNTKKPQRHVTFRDAMKIPSIAEMQKTDKSRVEVGRDESITINLNQTLPASVRTFTRENSL